MRTLEFCLSGDLHDEEALRFARRVRPLQAARNPGRMPQPVATAPQASAT